MTMTPFSSSIACLLAASMLLIVGCDASPTCAERSKAFTDYVRAHRSCTVAADCVVIGDCGPNADFTAVRADSEAEARSLQLARCSGVHDGPIYDAVCVENVCALEMRTDTCCGCAPSDASVGDGG